MPSVVSVVEVCMKMGIGWLPWGSHGYGKTSIAQNGNWMRIKMALQTFLGQPLPRTDVSRTSYTKEFSCT